MKRFIGIALLCIFLIPLQAQPDKYKEGMEAYKTYKYETAIAALRLSLQDPAVIRNPRFKSNAHAYLSKSFYHIALSKEEKWKKQYPNPLVSAFEHLQEASKIDPKRRYSPHLKGYDPLLWKALYDKASNAYKSKDYLTAAKHFEGAASLHDADPQSTLMHGFSVYASGDPSGAIPQLEKGIRMYRTDAAQPPDSLLLFAYISLANIYATYLEDTPRALRTLQQGHVDFPGQSQFSSLKLQLYVQDPSLAPVNVVQAQFRKELSNHPNDMGLLTSYADFCAKQQQIKRGDSLYTKILKLSSKDTKTQLRYAKYLETCGRYKEAYKVFDKLAKRSGSDPNIRIQYAHFLDANDHDQEAKAYYESLLKKNPTDFYANFNMGAYFINRSNTTEIELRKTKDMDKAKEMYDSMLSNMRMAYPYMKQAHKKRPTDLTALQQMLKLATFLRLEEERNEYEKLLKKRQKP